jgi:hypothetical protein
MLLMTAKIGEKTSRGVRGQTLVLEYPIGSGNVFVKKNLAVVEIGRTHTYTPTCTTCQWSNFQ